MFAETPFYIWEDGRYKADLALIKKELQVGGAISSHAMGFHNVSLQNFGMGPTQASAIATDAQGDAPMDAPTPTPADPALTTSTSTTTTNTTTTKPPPQKRKHQEVASPDRQGNYPKAEQGKYTDFPHTRAVPGPYRVINFVDR